jgi:hypothetical protein
MDPLTVVVHDTDDPFSAGTVAVLSDWSAAGWLRDFVLVSVAEVLARGAALAQDRVVLPPTPGQPPVVRALARLLEGRSLRIVVLDPVGRDASWLAARERRHEAGRLLFDRGTRRVGALDLLIPWHGGHWDPQLPIWPGWDTLIAAPQESVSPLESGLDLHCDPDDPEQVLGVSAHAAAFVATAGALWEGVTSSPWDDSESLDDVRMARAFHIRLDGSEVRTLMSAAALSPAALRSPDAIAAAGTGDFPARVKELRDRLHLEPRPPAPQPQIAQGVGAWQAIGMLVSFLWRSLVMAPRELSATLVGRVKSASASRLTSLIFGMDSGKQVTVRGTPGSGSTEAAVRQASSSEERLAEILADLRRLDPNLAPATAGSSQDVFWRASVDTVMALVSGERRHGIDPVTDEGVARWFTPEQVAPASALTWRPMDGVAVPGMRGDVPVHDVLACDDALEELQALGSLDGHWRDDVDRNRRDLAQASAQWRASFLGQVGTMLSGEIGRFRGLLSERIDALRSLEEPPQGEADDLAAQLVRYTRTATIVAVVVGLIVALLDATNVVSWRWWAWLPMLILTWLGTLVVGYLGVQRRIFHLVHRADEQDSTALAIEREIPTLVENLRRLRRVYDQYLVWAQILPVFLQEPFGRATESPSQMSRMSGHVPASVITGHYAVRDQALANRRMAGLVRDARPSAAAAWSTFLDCTFGRLAQERSEFAGLVLEDVYRLEDQRLDALRARTTITGPHGAALVDDVAEELGRRQIRSVMERTDLGHVRALVEECFSVRSVDGRLIQGVSMASEPAPFRSEAFSLAGLERDLTIPDPALDHRGRSDRRMTADEDGVLDEVASLLITTRRLAPSDLALQAALQRSTTPVATRVPDLSDRVVF